MKVEDLRLVIVHTPDGDELVSLALGRVLCSTWESDSLTSDPGTPEVYVGEKEEGEARALAGLPASFDWPGWEVIIPWLETKVGGGK